jgi:7-cyano-7-deazaguanine synthase
MSTSVAVLLSGGLDSAVLLAEEARRVPAVDVHPIYVSVGLAWESGERSAVERILSAAQLGPQIRALLSLSVDMSDVYPATHWARQGRPPGYHTPDEDVYLHGRNIVLLAKAGIYCASAGIDRVVIGTLDHNPFPDATPAFRQAMASALSLGLAHALVIDAPYAHVGKADVIRRGTVLGLPLELTLSCMRGGATGGQTPVGADGSTGVRPPLDEQAGVRPPHCGLCSKCRERHDAFLEAGAEDPTDYVDRMFMR